MSLLLRVSLVPAAESLLGDPAPAASNGDSARRRSLSASAQVSKSTMHQRHAKRDPMHLSFLALARGSDSTVDAVKHSPAQVAHPSLSRQRPLPTARTLGSLLSSRTAKQNKHSSSGRKLDHNESDTDSDSEDAFSDSDEDVDDGRHGGRKRIDAQDFPIHKPLRRTFGIFCTARGHGAFGGTVP